MDLWIVQNGDVYALNDASEDADGMRLSSGKRLWGEDYGSEWLIVEANSEEDAREQAARFDARTHPAQVEMELAAALYQSGERWFQTADRVS